MIPARTGHTEEDSTTFSNHENSGQSQRIFTLSHMSNIKTNNQNGTTECVKDHSLKLLGLAAEGTREFKTKKLCNTLLNIKSLLDNDDMTINTERNSEIYSKTRTTTSEVKRYQFNFRDIEDTIRKFSGKDLYSIESFLEDIEENRLINNWDDMETCIFTKKRLDGLGKLYCQ